jgi:hypothetical protein
MTTFDGISVLQAGVLAVKDVKHIVVATSSGFAPGVVQSAGLDEVEEVDPRHDPKDHLLLRHLGCRLVRLLLVDNQHKVFCVQDLRQFPEGGVHWQLLALTVSDFGHRVSHLDLAVEDAAHEVAQGDHSQDDPQFVGDRNLVESLAIQNLQHLLGNSRIRLGVSETDTNLLSIAIVILVSVDALQVSTGRGGPFTGHRM